MFVVILRVVCTNVEFIIGWWFNLNCFGAILPQERNSYFKYYDDPNERHNEFR